ncbi:hypothetical protein [Leptospira andrefontaineae]|uniref:Uncharacterized protein n=1 Tax=Leptospira andrefontaineae TaxID=2484976 RepID=A0A4R9GX32_9LEPT|nr:hypothetical protein [Leptospira andrefontaineae]TGK35837.1 hypothetical protein EHO65_19585 [Leptospira andrefontaineae]
MKIYALGLLLPLIIFANCDGSSDDQNAVLALLLNKKCMNFPKNTTVFDSGGDPLVEFSCSVSGKTYICSDGPSIQYRTYSSIEGALLGVVNPPGGGGQGFGFFPSQRGLLRNKTVSASNPTNISYNFIYTYDFAHRLVSAFNAIDSNDRVYGDYDLNGFPLDVDGISANYSYDPGNKRPSSISIGGTNMFFDTNGWAIGLEDGDIYSFQNSGSLQVCD